VCATTESRQLDAVRLEPGLARTLLHYLGEPRREERGGVLLGQRTGRVVRIGGAVFPPQVTQSAANCAFDAHCIEVISSSISAMADPPIAGALEKMVGWIHSHPGHGLFLSHTDVATLDSWLQLDEGAIAVVVDPCLRRHHRRRMAWWDRQREGRFVELEYSEQHAVGFQQTAAMGQAIKDHEGTSEEWNVVTAGCIMRILPLNSDPAVNELATRKG